MFTAVSLPWFATCQKCLYEAGIWESIDYSMGSMVDECWLRLHSLLFRASVHHVAVTQQQVCSRRKGLGVPSHQTTIPGRASLSSVKSCKVSIHIPLFKLLWGRGGGQRHVYSPGNTTLSTVPSGLLKAFCQAAADQNLSRKCCGFPGRLKYRLLTNCSLYEITVSDASNDAQLPCA